MATALDHGGSSLRHLLADSGEPPARVDYRTDLVTALLGVWFVGGLLLDAWAHNNVPELESFFTPWHAVFYSGFTATALWILWQVWTNLRAGRRGRAAVPDGYAAAVVALPAFAVFGVGDYLWHTVFGIEQNIDILFSPTHLGLVTSMVVIVTAPLRSAWQRPRAGDASLLDLLPAILAVAFGTTQVLLFLQYGNALTYSAEAIVVSLSEGGASEALAATIMANQVITALVLVAPPLLLVRRWRLPAGAVTLTYLPIAVLSAAVAGFGNLTTVLGVVAAGVVLDVLVAWLRPAADRRAAFWAFGGLAAFVTWSLYVGIAMVVTGQLAEVPELWTGAPIVMGLLGLLLAVVLLPNAVDRRPTADRRA